MKSLKWIMVIALTLLMASPALAGWVIKYEAGGMGSPESVYIQDNMMRQEMGQILTIMDVNKQWFNFINPQLKKYWAGPIDQFGKKAEDEVEKRMQEMLKNLPPEQRKMAMKAMKQQRGGGEAMTEPQVKYTVKKTGKTAKIAGYKCMEYKITGNGKPFMDLWISPEVKIFKEIDARKMAAMMDKMMQHGKKGGGPMSSPDVMALWTKGYPLKQVTYFMGQANTSTASKVIEKDIKGSMFTVPDGYTKVDSMMDLMR